MKTIFEINDEIFNTNMMLPDCYKHYNKYYKDSCFTLYKKTEDVCVIYDKEINFLNKGDYVDFGDEIRIIDRKCLDIVNDTIIYSLKRI